MFPAKFIDKYNDFIQYLNTHSVFTGTVSSHLFCLSVCQSRLEVCPGAFELSGKRVSARTCFIFFHHTTGCTVNGHDSKIIS